MSNVSRKHQVTLPVSVLKDAGLAAGDEVVIRAIGHGRIEAERAETSSTALRAVSRQVRIHVAI
jgi:bifunctional DNA-binding transcriptional regulator/antitoxin component of YhaV-PrlF toxin-antitoxin module